MSAKKEKKANIAVLISGGGTNLQAILDAEKAGALHSGTVKLVISNRKGAYGLERAKNAGVKAIAVTRKEARTSPGITKNASSTSTLPSSPVSAAKASTD